MLNTGTWSTCRIICWCLAGLIGLFVLFGISDSVGFFAALMAGAALAVFIGLVATRLVCTGETDAAGDHGHGAAGAASGAAAASQAGSTVAEKASDAASTTAEAAKSAADNASDVAEGVADKGKKVAGKAKEAAKDAVETVGDKANTATPVADEKAPKHGDAGPGANAKAQTAATPDYDGDGVLEGDNEGVKPETLSAPKGGKADNLKEIKGVGPKLETLLHDMGFYHFDQIANWGVDEVAWVDANLQGFKGRVSRDNWVEQAKILASGGETEFSKRAKGGDVY